MAQAPAARVLVEPLDGVGAGGDHPVDVHLEIDQAGVGFLHHDVLWQGAVERLERVVVVVVGEAQAVLLADFATAVERLGDAPEVVDAFLGPHPGRHEVFHAHLGRLGHLLLEVLHEVAMAGHGGQTQLVALLPELAGAHAPPQAPRPFVVFDLAVAKRSHLAQHRARVFAHLVAQRPQLDAEGFQGAAGLLVVGWCFLFFFGCGGVVLAPHPGKRGERAGRQQAGLVEEFASVHEVAFFCLTGNVPRATCR